MPSFRVPESWTLYLLWNAGCFAVAIILNSFIEWAAHRFILHSPKILKFPYDLHHVGHHGMFGSDHTYHAQNDEMRGHITFVLRDYLMFLAVTTPIWVVSELVLQRPLIAGGVLATLTGLQLFNSFHLRFHLPSDTWFQRTRFFRFLKEHHRVHHSDTTKNFNVYFFPIADKVMGTLKRVS